MSNLTARKLIQRGPKAKQSLLDGALEVHEAVAATLGPRSDNVVLERPWGVPAVVHDGVTVAKEVIPLKDPFQNQGAELIVQAAERTGAVGDGTTTATVLTYAIAAGAHAVISAGLPAMAVRRGIEKAVEAVSDHIGKNATAVSGKDRLKQVAQVSAQLEDIGDMVVSAVEQVGHEGVITVEESGTTETFVEVKQGMEFERGFKSPHFITSHEKGEAEITDAVVIVTDMRISSMDEFLPVLELVVNQLGKKNIVLIADDIDGEPLATLIVNKVKGTMQTLAIQAPNFGEKRQAILEDIAIVTGATVVSAEKGMSLKEFKAEYLGTATRIKSSSLSTVIVGGGGSEEAVAKRAASIKTQADNPDTSEFDREKYQERHAKLTTGVAVVHVGAKTESEMKERKERTIDAISAVKAAALEGIVAGGGVALIKALKALDGLKLEGEGEQAGIRIVRKACEAPYSRLLSNSGLDGSRFHSQISQDDHKGVDVISGEVVDMIEKGIIDPAKVVRAALENAASAAIMLFTSSVIVVEEPPQDLQHVTAR